MNPSDTCGVKGRHWLPSCSTAWLWPGWITVFLFLI